MTELSGEALSISTLCLTPWLEFFQLLFLCLFKPWCVDLKGCGMQHVFIIWSGYWIQIFSVSQWQFRNFAWLQAVLMKISFIECSLEAPLGCVFTGLWGAGFPLCLPEAQRALALCGWRYPLNNCNIQSPLLWKAGSPEHSHLSSHHHPLLNLASLDLIMSSRGISSPFCRCCNLMDLAPHHHKSQPSQWSKTHWLYHSITSSYH